MLAVALSTMGCGRGSEAVDAGPPGDQSILPWHLVMSPGTLSDYVGSEAMIEVQLGRPIPERAAFLTDQDLETLRSNFFVLDPDGHPLTVVLPPFDKNDRVASTIHLDRSGWYTIGFSALPSSVVTHLPELPGLGYGIQIHPGDAPTPTQLSFCRGTSTSFVVVALNDTVTLGSADALTVSADGVPCSSPGGAQSEYSWTCPSASPAVLRVTMDGARITSFAGAHVALVNGRTTLAQDYPVADFGFSIGDGCVGTLLQ